MSWKVEELLHERLDPDITHNRGSWLFSVAESLYKCEDVNILSLNLAMPMPHTPSSILAIADPRR